MIQFTIHDAKGNEWIATPDFLVNLTALRSARLDHQTARYRTIGPALLDSLTLPDDTARRLESALRSIIGPRSFMAYRAVGIRRIDVSARPII